jgi:murein DD-endopeptidase MepM/ murein hydrolase activator NlpD
MYTVLGILLTSLLFVVSYRAPRQEISPQIFPVTSYMGRFAQKKQYRQSIRSLTHQIKPGDTLYGVLLNHGVPPREVGTLVVACKSQPEFKKLKTGEVLELFFNRQSRKLEKVRYHNVNDQVLTISRTHWGWVISSYTEQSIIASELARGTIKDSLYQSAVEQGIHFELALALADIFAWDIDFFTDLRPNDHYQFLYEQHFQEGKLVGNGRILAAHFTNAGKNHRGYYYQVQGKKADYYDADGRSLRKQFLKSPLRYTRISSGFSKRRLHPILKIYRPHPGVDYAAPTGTPVVSVGDGRVVFKGWKKGYGRFIAIRHNSRYTTTYGHLSRYGAKSKKGHTVKQGQVIGYVGATGLATGPHLDFRMKKNGRFVNPLKQRFPSASPVPSEYLEEFKRRVASLEGQFGQLLAQGGTR